MSEIDNLFGNIKGTSFGADPNSVPQEGAIGGGTIQGVGFVQSGGYRYAPIGGVASAPVGGQTTSLALHSAVLIPVPVIGLMIFHTLRLSCGVLAGTSVGIEWALLADDGQGVALVVVAGGSSTLSSSAISIKDFIPTEVVLPPGMYWLILRTATVTGGGTFDYSYLDPFTLITGFLGTLSGSLPAVGSQFVVASADWTGSLAQACPVGLLTGKVFGGELGT